MRSTFLRSDRRRSYGRPLAWGLGISILLHLILALFATRIWFPVRDHLGGGVQTDPRGGAAIPEMQAYRIRVLDGEAPTSPEERPVPPMVEEAPIRRPAPPEEEVAPVDARTGGGVGGEEATPPAASPRSPAERLRPGVVDPRLWQRAEAPPPPEKTDIEVARERVYARLQMLNDSLAADAAAASRATDWTFTDKDGKKWGVSPGKVHLGGVTIPLPFGFSPPPDQAREARDRAGKAAEIERQSDRARIRESFDEQVKRTREERDRARSAKRDSTKSGGT